MPAYFVVLNDVIFTFLYGDGNKKRKSFFSITSYLK